MAIFYYGFYFMHKTKFFLSLNNFEVFSLSYTPCFNYSKKKLGSRDLTTSQFLKVKFRSQYLVINISFLISLLLVINFFGLYNSLFFRELS